MSWSSNLTSGWEVCFLSSNGRLFLTACDSRQAVKRLKNLRSIQCLVEIEVSANERVGYAKPRLEEVC